MEQEKLVDEEVEVDDFPSAFVRLPKRQKNIELNETKVEKIPDSAVQEINQSTMKLPEIKEEKEIVSEIEKTSESGFSGMYILMSLLMIGIIGISIAGFILS